ncbi:rRNA maturation RNase YbeY [Merismopedia glauca CCAP 1448/3]|uniref:Endoribonuclease YbeY n=1 Tax=Merismopedia glauca CCAP 1448/3 TaxID=1296344 RepID=A0A2T1BZM4_9CYAN|nr:rRNA maturation RNase YbeY [Merismopedia glauca CCAP 1448/3]
MELEVSIQDSFLEQIEGQNPALIANFQKVTTEAKWEDWFEQWLATMSFDLPQAEAYEISLRFTTDPEIQALNAQYRHQNHPTDVLAFAALEVDYPKLPSCVPLYLGDIVISVETADRQAQVQNHPLITELAWLAAHGFLHLLGWDHPDDENLRQMLQQQDVLLAKIGLNMELPLPSE